MIQKFRYYKIYKPYRMLSQFSKVDDKLTLKDLNFHFNKDIYPIGRLDYDSEGLLLLTNDNKLKTILLDPKMHHQREYFVQVDGNITDEACKQLEKGVFIDGYKTLPAIVKIIPEPTLPERIPPIRFRKNVPTSWISITLVEGKNRQIRKMTAKVGFPTLRLVRYRILNITIDNMQPGDVIEVEPKIIIQILKKA